MNVIDKNSQPIDVGTEVRDASGLREKGAVSVVERLIDDEPEEGVFTGQYTGQVIVILGGEEVSYPTFAYDHYDICRDLETTTEEEDEDG